MANRLNPYALIRDELASRTMSPFWHVSYVIYFVLAVLWFGALGFWIELYAYVTVPTQGAAAIKTSLLTFFPALAGSTLLQLVWEEDEKYMRSFALLLLGIFLLAALLIGPASSMSMSIFFASLASLAALWVWWFTNSKQAGLLDKTDPTAPVGGDNPDKAALPGNLDAFRH